MTGCIFDHVNVRQNFQMKKLFGFVCIFGFSAIAIITTLSGYAGAAEDRDLFLTIDNGYGISPRNFIGLGIGQIINDHVTLGAGIANGSRSNVLGPAYNGEVLVSRQRFYGAVGLTGYTGAGKVPIAFSKKTREVDHSGDPTIERCNSGICDHNNIAGERSAMWNIIYANIGAGIVWGKNQNWFGEAGVSKVIYFKLKVNELPNDYAYGDVEGVLVDRSAWAYDSIVSKNDSGPYVRIGFRFYLI